MNKRLLGGATLLFASTCLFCLIFIIILAYDLNLSHEESMKNPSYLSSYSDSGYFKINPKTILASLDQGNVSVFMQLLEDPNSIEPLTNVSFSWAQGDFFKIAGTLGQFVWKDPMNMEDWSVKDVAFRTDCQDNLNGFDLASITYFTPIDVKGKRAYTTRYIEIDPYYSMVRWGSEATYPQPILLKWRSFNLATSTITAEEALRISENHGGKEARLQFNNKCVIYVSSSKDNDKWHVDYISTNFATYVDPYTGEYKILSTSQ
jgi:hypothetical protein